MEPKDEITLEDEKAHAAPEGDGEADPSWRWIRCPLGTGPGSSTGFNNDHEGHAVHDARWLADRLAQDD